MSQPPWLRQASALPVAFAQVREDPLLDEQLVRVAGDKVRICMVASGGCTAAALAAMPSVELIHCVDPNLAQLALARIKVALLCHADPSERLAALGADASDPATRIAAITRAAQWAQQDAAALGPAALLAELGLDQMGRYERLFAALRAAMADAAPQISDLLRLADPAEQSRRIAPAGATWRGIERAFHDVMALPHLVALFGEGATRNPREPFALHFLRRLRWVLETLPALGNPFLAQLLCGKFVGGHVHRWIGLPRQTRLPTMQWQQSFMVPALLAQPHS